MAEALKGIYRYTSEDENSLYFGNGSLGYGYIIRLHDEKSTLQDLILRDLIDGYPLNLDFEERDNKDDYSYELPMEFLI